MSARRKLPSAGSVEPILHGSKRRKVSDDQADETETPQKTTEVGLKLIEDIKQATDKNGRLIANEFFELPDKKRHPGYYKAIALPISLNSVIGKLNDHQYATLTELESDLKRLVSNAKKYNGKGSLLFADAERIRKIVTGTMPKINPAYNDPNYVPFPTPIPEQAETQTSANNDEGLDGQEENADADADADAEDEKSAQPSEQALEKDEHEELSFEGDTIQLAQDKIISEMIHLRDEKGREVGAPFLYKPDRNLYKEYYEIIQHPVSLRSLLKQVRGIEGRKPHSRKTAFPNWRSFAEEMDFVWGNAREFNEDDSEIVDLAKILEAHFKRRLEEAKSAVPDPVQENVDEVNPRIKLKLGSSKTPEPASQRLMLRFPGQKLSSVEDKTSASASLDGDSSQRQQELAKADRSGLSIARDSRGTPDSSRLGPAAHVLGQGSPMPTSIITPSPSQTPIPSAANADVLMHSIAGGHDQMINPWLSGNPSTQPYQSYASVDSIFRKPGQDVSDALIKTLTIKSHSSLGPRPKFSLQFPASPTVRQQSLVVNVPASQSFLSLSVKITPNTPQIRTKFVALFGPQKIILAPQPHSNPSELFYDIRLPHGLTKVDFQMASIRQTGPEATDSTVDKREFERLTVFFRLVR